MSIFGLICQGQKGRNMDWSVFLPRGFSGACGLPMKRRLNGFEPKQISGTELTSTMIRWKWQSPLSLLSPVFFSLQLSIFLRQQWDIEPRSRALLSSQALCSDIALNGQAMWPWTLGPQRGISCRGEGTRRGTCFAWSSVHVQLTMVSHRNV